jgi:hypothetical protein
MCWPVRIVRFSAIVIAELAGPLDDAGISSTTSWSTTRPADGESSAELYAFAQTARA